MSAVDPGRIVKPVLACPSACPWQPHPENDAWQRCGVQSCLIERPKPEGKSA